MHACPNNYEGPLTQCFARSGRHAGAEAHRDVAGTVNAVEAVDVVHDTVAVIVDAIAGDLAHVDPQVGRKVRMRHVEAGVDDADGDVSCIALPRPRPRKRAVVARACVQPLL